MAKQKKTVTTDILDYTFKSVSPYHTVAASAELLKKAGFTELKANEDFILKDGGKYYIIPFKSELFAFTVNGDGPLRVAAAHTDFPCLHVKPKAELVSGGYLRLNTEVYGGPILNTWLDRPLSLAGRVMLRSKNIYAPKEVMVDFARPILTIPNLAVHYNREVNKGVELKKQNDMLPLLGMLTDTLERDNYFLTILAKELGEAVENILDFDLFVYNAEAPTRVGLDEALVSAARLDNLTSCFALVKGLIDAKPRKGLNVIALFDNEEIGSQTKQGADSDILRGLLNRILLSLGKDEAALERMLPDGFLLSVDVAHALHPAHQEKYDSVNNMLMGQGITIKLSANQRYTYDAGAVAALQQLCEKYDVKYKKFVNNSDMPGGSTLGPLISSHLPMRTVDLGVPILAMHSARELMAEADQLELEKLLTAFFTE